MRVNFDLVDLFVSGTAKLFFWSWCWRLWHCSGIFAVTARTLVAQLMSAVLAWLHHFPALECEGPCAAAVR
jgi:hypothetical protein